MSLVSLIAVVLSFARINLADNSDNQFIFPNTPGPNADYVADFSFTLGSSQKIQWTTTLDSYNIYLYQQAIDPSSGQEVMTIYGT